MKAMKTDTSLHVDEQPKLQSLLRELLQEATESWEQARGVIRDVESRSRDGFIRAPDNFGGMEAVSYELYGGQRYGSHLANAALERLPKQAIESWYAESDIDPATTLTAEQQEEQDQYVDGCLQDETIKLELRILYCGVEGGTHTAYVSSYINWEAPYHRPSAAVWRALGGEAHSPKPTRYDDFREVEVRWRTEGGARRSLKKALKEVSALFDPNTLDKRSKK